ncbi:hypothetical protein HUN03_00802 [Mycoplasmopsis anatis]|nr:hypothetical protein [Mycoplasmopsis anatis]MBW0594363.1 hypothetical protein [Mycoplasmopsis anatis]MBW0595016.1 hypothetical protein [Mycoplasmopsis anatis]MBW0595765.1 hypothetical protein [Mycoplasmopsis anatis]MBW0597312.1 hypothetical protein [Mycoplasmopsis anatis]MBW0598233.1 hypothetical protein [Mycoplasmopsis anatis]
MNKKININELNKQPKNNFSIKYGLKVGSKLNRNQLASQVSIDEINKNVKFDIKTNIKLIDLKPFDDSGQLILTYKFMNKEIDILINGFKKKKSELKIIDDPINSAYIEVPNDNNTHFNGYFIDYEVVDNDRYPLKWFLLIPDDKSRFISSSSSVFLLKGDKKIKVNNIQNIIAGKDVLIDNYVNLAVVEVNFENEAEARDFTNNNFSLIPNNLSPFFKKLDGNNVKSVTFDSKIEKEFWFYTDSRDLNLYLYNISIDRLSNEYKEGFNRIKKLRVRNSYFDGDEASGSSFLNNGYLFLYDNKKYEHNNFDENNVGLYTPISTIFNNKNSHLENYSYDFIYGSDNLLQQSWYLKSLVEKYPKIQTKLLNDYKFNNKKWFVGEEK